MTDELNLQFPVGFDLTWVIAGLLLIPYLLWGQYTLLHRLRDGAEFSPATESVTLLLVGLLYFLQYYLLREWLVNTPLYFFIAFIGLVLSGLALYGHMAVSLVSLALVDVVAPSSRRVHEPNYGPGEAAEANGDFEGAVHEYETVARMFPKDVKAAARLADNLTKLDRWEEAAPYFETAIENAELPDQAIPILFRLADVYMQRLERPRAARDLYVEFLQRYPDSPFSSAVKARLDRLDV